MPSSPVGSGHGSALRCESLLLAFVRQQSAELCFPVGPLCDTGQIVQFHRVGRDVVHFKLGIDRFHLDILDENALTAALVRAFAAQRLLDRVPHAVFTRCARMGPILRMIEVAGVFPYLAVDFRNNGFDVIGL